MKIMNISLIVISLFVSILLRGNSQATVYHGKYKVEIIFIITLKFCRGLTKMLITISFY